MKTKSPFHGIWYDPTLNIKIRDRNRGGYFRQLHYPFEQSPIFESNRICLGFDKMMKKQVFLSVNEAFRAILLGPTRDAGKTWAIQSIISRAKQSNFDLLIFDPKNEFDFCRNPLQQKFHQLLNKKRDETPMSLNVKTYRPYFLIKHDGRNIYNQIPCQISLQQCSPSDLTTILNINGKDDQMKRDMLMQIYEGIQNGNITTIEEMEIAIWKLKDYTTPSKKSFCNTLQPLKKNDVLGTDHPIDVVSDILDGYVPNINLIGFDDFSREFSGYPQAYLSVILRQVVRAKRKKLLKNRLMVVIDETPRFVPESIDTSSKKEVLEAVDLVAGLGIDFVFAAQDVDNIPPELIRQSKFVFLAKAAGKDLVKKIYGEKGFSEFHPQWIDNKMSEFRDMRRYEWVMINGATKKEHFFKFYAPLCAHKQTEGR